MEYIRGVAVWRVASSRYRYQYQSILLMTRRLVCLLCLLLRVVRNTAVLRCAALLVKELSIRKHATTPYVLLFCRCLPISVCCCCCCRQKCVYVCIGNEKTVCWFVFKRRKKRPPSPNLDQKKYLAAETRKKSRCNVIA